MIAICFFVNIFFILKLYFLKKLMFVLSCFSFLLVSVLMTPAVNSSQIDGTWVGFVVHIFFVINIITFIYVMDRSLAV